MRYRTFGRTGWQISEVGYGMWGMAGWTGSDDEQSFESLDRAIELGCNFFDTAWAYGDGHSEQLLGATLKRHPEKRLYIATKIPPKNRKWPAKPSYTLDEVFPPEYIREYTEKSLRNIGVSTLDLQQLHVWTDEWATDDRWQRALRALDSGLIDAVQVVYNVFDQNPEDALFPYCQKHQIAIIARVPFDEGSLTDRLTADSTWPAGDFRNLYFNPDNLQATLGRVARLREVVPSGMTMPQLALRHILTHPAVSTVIPGMRQMRNVEQNLGVSDGQPLAAPLMAELKKHRWDRSVDFE
jgi:aryl-alcohol dehydrogenase-like predicted oxidoreductase